MPEPQESKPQERDYDVTVDNRDLKVKVRRNDKDQYEVISYADDTGPVTDLSDEDEQEADDDALAQAEEDVWDETDEEAEGEKGSD